MISYSIHEHGSLNVIRELEAIKARAEDVTPAWSRVHEYMMLISKRQFEGGGRRGPNKWANLEPSTIARKRRGGFRIKKMYRTENTVSSIVNMGHPNHVFESDHDSMTFGSDLESAMVQQAGYAGAPFRPPLDPTNNDVRNMTKIVSDSIMSMKKGGGLGVVL